jgi:2-polyprenyl-3-methyl-5-hydroxy-6-metoxy-1,4-benzoquinol methylase
MAGIAETVDRPSVWVRRFVPLIRAGALVLDFAAGSGRHSRLLLESGFTVRAVDRDVSALGRLAGSRCEVRQIDLESGGRMAAATAMTGSS